MNLTTLCLRLQIPIYLPQPLLLAAVQIRH